MTTRPHTHTTWLLTGFPRAAGVGVAAFGGVVLAGWAFDIPALRNRCDRRRTDLGHQARGVTGKAAEGGSRMIKKRGRMQRRLIVLGSAGGSIADLALGLWRGDSSKRWLVPLAVFLCLFGLVLILATTVEALAPFIYAIF